MLLYLQTLCRMCHENKVYMLAFECFEERWRFPKAYHLFYDHFFKAAVGEKKWKESLEDNKPFGNSNTEAFALMLLKNNYHAWMAQAYSVFEFENQYDIERKERKRKEDDDGYQSSVERTKKSILDEVLPNFEYCLIPKDLVGTQNQQEQSKRNDESEERDENDDDALTSTSSNDGGDDEDKEDGAHGQYLCLDYDSSWVIITPDGDPGMYLNAMSFNKGCLELARQKISDSDLEDYASAVASLQRLDTNVSEVGERNTASGQTAKRRRNSRAALLLIDEPIDDAAVDAIREGRGTTPLIRKRRKILKELKCFTKKGNVHNVKQRGWSCRGYNYHADLTKQILRDEEADKPFVDLYRKLTLKIETIKAEINQPHKKEKILPDRNEVWQLV